MPRQSRSPSRFTVGRSFDQLFGFSRHDVEWCRTMVRRRVRTGLRFAKNLRRSGSHLEAWPVLPLNCPLCGQHLAPRAARDTYVYACADHGDFFAAAEDGRLYDVPKTSP